MSLQTAPVRSGDEKQSKSPVKTPKSQAFAYEIASFESLRPATSIGFGLFRPSLILRLLPRMPSLAAVSLAGVSLFQVLDKLNASETIVDQVLAFCAVMLLCNPVTIGAVRTKHIGRALFLGRMALVMFLSVIMLLVFAGCYVLLGLYK